MLNGARYDRGIRAAAGIAESGAGNQSSHYGWNDFEIFDEEAARGSHLCVGSVSIGKVDIDCKYHWKRAQWGVLGNEKRPAGIVYMDLIFKQPHGYWLDHASVFVTLSEDNSSYALVGPRRSNLSSRKPALVSDYAVQITEHGPRFLTGAKTLRSETKANHFVPTVSAMGFQVGGMGHQSSTSKQRAGRWVFKGTVGKPRGRDGFRTLQWELSENDLDPDQAHSQQYHTAFAFEHSQRPVFMRVEVEGKIRSKTRQIKHGLLRFSSQFGKKDNSTLTHMNFSEDVVFKKHLDHIAKGLDMAMQMENCQSTPLEVPGPTPAQFVHGTRPDYLASVTNQYRHPANLTSIHGEHNAVHISAVQASNNHHPSQSSHPSHPPSVTDQRQSVLAQGQPRGKSSVSEVSEGQEEEQEEAWEPEEELEDGIDNTLLRSLHRRLQDRTDSDLAAHIRMEETRQASVSESPSPDDTDMTTTTAVNSDASNLTHVPESVEEDIRDLFVRIPVLLFFLRYIATMMKWLARPQSLPSSAKVCIPPPSLQRDSSIGNSGRLLEESASRLLDRVLEGPEPPVLVSVPALARKQSRRSG